MSSHCFQAFIDLAPKRSVPGLQLIIININKGKIKDEIKVYGGKLRLMWHFCNNHREFDVNPFTKKSKFNPKRDAIIEMYLTRLEEELLLLDEKIFYSDKRGKTCFIFTT